ncbi:hypothetical protein [Deinococcus multiflagellatus]|uniref:Uncharacterized protein n=1 Tax=Deinococcus multiflagellatus TaxID=1656887 RepID=A0ABW1ZS65_9DEIO|nr:hypothetical protein [Deinococcus multiflagellatus]MBZ9714882.1 hypothetical protein [Deinococcus multiflagellatus]
MLSAPHLAPSLNVAAANLLSELRLLHPDQPATVESLVSLMDAVTTQATNLLVRHAASFSVAVDQTGQDVVLAVQSGRYTHGLSVRDLARSMMYVSASGDNLHLAFEEQLLNRDDAVDVLLRLSETPVWNELLTQSVLHTVRTLHLIAEEQLDPKTAQLIALQDAADVTGQTQIACQPHSNIVFTHPPAARHQA